MLYSRSPDQNSYHLLVAHFDLYVFSVPQIQWVQKQINNYLHKATFCFLLRFPYNNSNYDITRLYVIIKCNYLSCARFCNKYLAIVILLNHNTGCEVYHFIENWCLETHGNWLVLPECIQCKYLTRARDLRHTFVLFFSF
jgi:hypothetical protein